MAMMTPGQARLLEAPKQGAARVYLDWKAPVDGSKPAAYKIMRRLSACGHAQAGERPEGPWLNVGTAIETEITLADQPERVEIEYRVIAINKAGESEPSNTVMAVL